MTVAMAPTPPTAAEPSTPPPTRARAPRPRARVPAQAQNRRGEASVGRTVRWAHRGLLGDRMWQGAGQKKRVSEAKTRTGVLIFSWFLDSLCMCVLYWRAFVLATFSSGSKHEQLSMGANHVFPIENDQEALSRMSWGSMFGPCSRCHLPNDIVVFCLCLCLFVCVCFVYVVSARG